MTDGWDLARVLDEGKRLRNWGRWGADDQIGTLHHITPDRIVAAARLVRSGKVISCALPFDENGPQPGGRRFNALRLSSGSGADAAAGAQDIVPVLRWADDIVIMPLQCGTQWDGLAHVFAEGVMYGGHDMTLVTGYGAARNGIERVSDRVVSRGVLFDVPALLARDSLDPGEPVTAALLDRCVEAFAPVEPGDTVLVRTGHMARCRAAGSWDGYAGGDAPGLALDTAAWLHERDVAAVATDTWGVEVRPNPTVDCFQPLHVRLIVNMGMTLGEIFDLDPLAADCAADGRYEFLFVAPPLPFTGAVGSPVNPYAIK